MRFEHLDGFLLGNILGLEHRDSSFEIIDRSLLVVILALERQDSSFESFDGFLLGSVLRLKVHDLLLLIIERLLLGFEVFELLIELRLLSLILLLQIGDPRLKSLVCFPKHVGFHLKALHVQGVDPDLLDQFMRVNFFLGIVAGFALGSRFVRVVTSISVVTRL